MKSYDNQKNVGEARRLEQATEWMLRLREDTVSEGDIVCWMKWCESDPRNHQAFDRVQEFWRVSGALAQEIVDGDLAGAAGKGHHTRGKPFTRLQAQLSDYWSSFTLAWYTHRGPMRQALAGAVVTGALCLGLVGTFYQQRHARDNAVVATARGELMHTTELTDGSKMELAAKSLVVVHYSANRRGLELRDGEAYFMVAPNAQRPFVVTVGPLRVRAVGTAFNVRRAGERFVVTVTKGTVDVYRADGNADATSSETPSGAKQVRATAGVQVTWDTPESKDPVVAVVDPATVLGWREGQLSYNDEPLSAVIADFNRYSERPASITDGGVKNMRFSGVLLTSATREWLHSLPAEFPVQVEPRGGIDVVEPRSRRGS
jgi:transmembrane sensor